VIRYFTKPYLPRHVNRKIPKWQIWTGRAVAVGLISLMAFQECNTNKVKINKNNLETKIDTLIEYYDDLQDKPEYRKDLKDTYVLYLDFIRMNSLKTDREQKYMTFMANVYVKHYVRGKK